MKRSRRSKRRSRDDEAAGRRAMSLRALCPQSNDPRTPDGRSSCALGPGDKPRDDNHSRGRPMSEPLLAVRGVKSFYGNIMALKGVALDVHEGEIVTLIGANGAGKSTLMMTIFGNPRAREGRIVYRGRDITDLPTHEIARLRIAQSPEGRRIFPRMTVRENLQMGAEIDAGAHFEEDLARVCTLFPVLARRLD